MAIEVIKNINVDFYDKKYILINAKQYDDRSRYISITCYNQGNIFNLSANRHTAYVRYRKSDGHGVFNVCRINYKGEVLVELTEQMLASSGVCYVDLIVVNKGSAIVNIDTGEITTIDDSQILSTMAFCVDVHESAVDNHLIESSYEYDGLNDLLTRAEADYSEVVQLSRSYAIGDANNARENENYDNSKYYSRIAKSYAIGDANNIRANENTDNAKYYSEQAHSSADAADESEANANAHMNAANEYMNTTNSYMNTTKGYMDSTKSYMDSTNEYMETTDTYMNNASASASNAATSEQNANTYMNNAKTSETNAKESETKAKSSETKALSSEQNAKDSEDKAKTSETNAGNSETNAKTYMDSAKASETIAVNSANEAMASEENASQSEVNAAASASAASLSENNAKTSETNANNYYTWTEQAVESVGGVFMPMGTITYSELAAIKESDTLRVGHLYNISDSFTSDETFKDGAGIEYVAGTNVFYTQDGYWDTLVGTAMIVDVATVNEVIDYLGIGEVN